MAMEAIFRTVGDVTIVDFRSRWWRRRIIDTATAIDAAFDAAKPLSPKLKLIVNLDGVRHLSPSALEQLRARVQEEIKMGAQIRLLGIQNIEDPQVAFQLADIAPVHEYEINCIRSFD